VQRLRHLGFCTVEVAGDQTNSDGKSHLAIAANGSSRSGHGWIAPTADKYRHLLSRSAARRRQSPCDRKSLDYTVGGSETLEYAIDDYAISRLAASLGEPRLAEKFLGHAMAWRYLFNSATGYLSARGEDGRFPTGPAFQGTIRTMKGLSPG
jgi:putative alpha-1,2-mannosidase